jgi:hypothetical protein
MLSIAASARCSDRFAAVRAIMVFWSQLLPTVAAIPLGVPLGHLCPTSLLTLFAFAEVACPKQRTLHSLLGLGIVRNFGERRLAKRRRTSLPHAPVNRGCSVVRIVDEKSTPK